MAMDDPRCGAIDPITGTACIRLKSKRHQEHLGRRGKKLEEFQWVNESYVPPPPRMTSERFQQIAREMRGDS
jgi:hypothetical protein